MDGLDYLNRGNIHLKEDRIKEACLDWKKASGFGIKEAYKLLWEYSPRSFDFENSPQEAKDQIIHGVKRLLDKLTVEPTFENLVRRVIILRGQEVAENLFKALQFGWENNGNVPVDYFEVYYKIFIELNSHVEVLKTSNTIEENENSSFPKLWMTSICEELNKAGFEMADYHGGGKFNLDRFENSNALMKDYVAYSLTIYEHLNSKGLVNRGFCPITGEKIGTEHFWEFFGRKVFISEKGKALAQEWDKKEHVKLFGKEPLTQMQKQEAYNNARFQIRYSLLFFIVLILFIIYLIKKC